MSNEMMTGVSERLTSATDALRGWAGEDLWGLPSIYYEHKEKITIKVSLNCQIIQLLLLRSLTSNSILLNVLYCSRDITSTRCLGDPVLGNLLLQGTM